VGAFQEMAPILQCTNDCQHLLVMNLVIPFY
jgi:hypothetical protein